MGPLPLITLCLVLGLLTSGADPTWALVLSLALVCLGATLGVRRSVVGALLLLAAAFGVGASQHTRITLPQLVSIPPTHADRLRLTVFDGCDATPHDLRCTVHHAALGRAVLRMPLGRCEAAPGDVIEVIATVRAAIPDRNPPRWGSGIRRLLQGERFRLDASSCTVVDREWRPQLVARRVAHRCRAALDRWLSRTFEANAAVRARALLFGDTTGLDPDLRADFRDTGLAHLLAVSGAHIALLVALIGRVARWGARALPWLTKRGWADRAGAAISLVCVALFALITGASASSMRALASAVLSACASLAGRRARAPDVLAAVTLVMLTAAPWLLLDIGFELSVVATWALTAREPADDPLNLTPPSAFTRLKHAAAEAVGANLRVSLAVTPLLAWSFGRAPLTASCMNLLAAPLGEALALPAVLVAVILPHPLDRPVAWLATTVLRALFALPTLASALPLASIAIPAPTSAESVCATIALGLAMRASPRGRLFWGIALVLALASLEHAHQRHSLPQGVLRVTALDVGQGDAIVVDLPDGAAMLVDGGGDLTGAADPGASEVVPWLRLQRRQKLAAVVLSHPHPDHFGGLAAVLRSVRVQAFWDTGQGELLRANEGYRAVRRLAEEAGVPVVGPAALCGGPRAFHGATIEVLAPCPSVHPALAPNDASFVIRLQFGRASVLLPGDLERTGEAMVMARLRPTTVLKVGHHGSRTSSSDAWLDRLQPSVALISCGHPSIFGHPHPSVLERLSRRGIHVRRTDLEGAVSVTLHADGRVE